MGDFDFLTGIIVPVSVCVVLPIMVVYLIMRRRINNDNKRADVLIKAIEANNDIDADKLAEALSKPKRTPYEILSRRLLNGCIFSLIGIGLVVTGIIGLCDVINFSRDGLSITLLSGMISLAIGISYLVVFFVTRKHVDQADGCQK